MKILIARHPNALIQQVGLATYVKHYGMLITPRLGSMPERALEVGATWAVDNEAFSNFNRERFTKLLKRLKQYPSPQWVAAPDVVGNAAATLARFRLWQPILRYYNYPVALVAQDGLECLTVPWNEFDALFIGGTTKWKLGQAAAKLAQEAKAQGKWVHMGRVNSIKRVRYAKFCNSIDGLSWAKFSKQKLKQILPYLEQHEETMWEGWVW